jgi:predicted transcriptional regulator
MASARARRDPKRLAMGALEGAVMNALWDADSDVTPAEVQAALAQHHDVAYTTVMTVLVRLSDKGRVERQRAGRAYRYRPTESREQHAARNMRAALAAGGDRSGALAAFVKGLDRRDREKLRRALGRNG